MASAQKAKVSLRGVPLVEQIVARLRPHVTVAGGDAGMLDRLENRLQVELPPTLRTFLAFDFTFASFGARWRGRGRFGRSGSSSGSSSGSNSSSVGPRISSLRSLADSMVELGFSEARLRRRLVRLPNLPNDPWNALYLGESRSDGELPILGLITDATSVLPYVRYTGFDLYLLEQSGLANLTEAARLDDLDSHLILNPELSSLNPDEDFDPSF